MHHKHKINAQTLAIKQFNNQFMHQF